MLLAITFYIAVSIFSYSNDLPPEGYVKEDPCIRCGEGWEYNPKMGM